MPGPTAVDVLVIGGGHAGAHMAISLRKSGFTGTIAVACDEPILPYDRPPLSKAYLKGAVQVEQLLLRDNAFWAEQQLSFHLGHRVDSLDVIRKHAALDDGRAFRFKWCVLATGGKLRRLACPGSDLAGLFYLRTIEDVNAIRDSLGRSERLGVIGAGYVGLEVAAAAREMGYQVDVIEAQERVLQRVTSPIVSTFLERQHSQRGVQFHLGEQVVGFSGDDRVSTIHLKSGLDIPVDLAIIGIGIDADTALAEAAGIKCQGGVLVDEHCRTSAEGVLAIGDCARHPNHYAGGLWRLESVQHAMDSAATAADTIMGQPKKYSALPTFWSEQFDIKLQSAGLNIDYDELIVRGDIESGYFSTIYLKNNKIISIDSVNSPKDFMGCRSAIVDSKIIDRDKIIDISIPLKKSFMAAGS